MNDALQRPTIEQSFIATLQEAQAADTLYRQNGDVAALEQVVHVWQNFLATPELSTAPDYVRFAALNNAAGALLNCYWTIGNVADLDRTFALATRLRLLR